MTGFTMKFHGVREWSFENNRGRDILPISSHQILDRTRFNSELPEGGSRFVLKQQQPDHHRLTLLPIVRTTSDSCLPRALQKRIALAFRFWLVEFIMAMLGRAREGSSKEMELLQLPSRKFSYIRLGFRQWLPAGWGAGGALVVTEGLKGSYYWGRKELSKAVGHSLLTVSHARQNQINNNVFGYSPLIQYYQWNMRPGGP